MNVHLSIHDVSPAWAQEIHMAVMLARRHGVKPALLVVPDFHGTWPLLAHPSFCRWLKSQSDDGCETYLHGFFHRARGKPARSVHDRVRHLVAQRWVSDHEAEFSDVSREEAAFLLEQGERVLARADLPVSGFVPPAWSMRPWLVPMLARRGYRFTEDHTRIYDPLQRRARASLVLNYATRTRARMLSTIAYCRIAPALSPLLPTRVAIHPADLRHAAVRIELDRLLSRFRGRFTSRAADLFATA
jgi:predicted deacetylase